MEPIDETHAEDGEDAVRLEHEDDGIKERAAGKLKGGGMTRDEFASIVEGTESEWLLERY